MATSWQIEQPTKQAFTDVVVDSTCDITFADTTVTMDDTSNLKVGMYVRGIYPSFDYGTNTTSTIYQVASITNSTTFELNFINVKGTESNVTLEFFHLGSFSPDNVTGKANSTDDFTLNVNTFSNLISAEGQVNASESVGAISKESFTGNMKSAFDIGDSVKIFSPFDILNNNTFEISGFTGTTLALFSITSEEDISNHAIMYERNPQTQLWELDGKISSGTTWGLDGEKPVATGTSWGFDGTIT